jgi:hypothetical protein
MNPTTFILLTITVNFINLRESFGIPPERFEDQVYATCRDFLEEIEQPEWVEDVHHSCFTGSHYNDKDG